MIHSSVINPAQSADTIILFCAGEEKSSCFDKKYGPYHEVNKKAVEVLVKTGAFDKLGQNRATLTVNMEMAMNYVERKLESTQFGQVSLFLDSGEKEFADFEFKQMEEFPFLERLEMEQECIGCYISGHPLDEHRNLIKTCSNISSMHLDRAQPDKQYQIIGLLKELNPIVTKSGKPMAFATLEDLNGTIPLVFFPKIWKDVSSLIQNDTLTALVGKIDNSKEAVSFLVDKVENISDLKSKQNWDVHIQLEKNFASEEQIYPIRDFLFGTSGIQYSSKIL